MKKRLLALLVVVVVVLPMLFAGCSSTPAPSASAAASASNAETAAASAAPAANAKPFIFAQGADPRGLDPAYVDDGESAKVMCNVYEGLLQYKGETTELEPCLAESWEVSADGLEYTFHLKKDVKFHDGTPFNAEAVKYNIDRQLPPKRTDDMPYASFTFGPVKQVDVVDDSTVKITLTAPYTPFLANLAMTLAAPMVSPTACEKAGGNLMENPVGTGPFKFVKWDKGQSLTLERNEEYWGTKALLPKVIFQFIKENNVRASKLANGEIDAMDGLDPNDVKMLENAKVSIFQAKGMNINYMLFNCSREPFNDPKLREAICRAINVPELVTALYQGYAEVANSPLPDFMPGYDKDVQQYGYDPAKATELIKELGKEGMSINMIAYSNARPYNPVTGQKLAEAVQGYLMKVGLKVTITPYDWTEYKKRIGNGEGDIAFYGWTGDNGDTDNFLSLLESKEIDSTLNSAKYSNTAIDDLLVKARSLPNGADRDNAYKQVQQLMAKDAPWLPISHSIVLAGYNPAVKGFTMHPTGSIFFAGVSK